MKVSYICKDHVSSVPRSFTSTGYMTKDEEKPKEIPDHNQNKIISPGAIFRGEVDDVKICFLSSLNELTNERAVSRQKKTDLYIFNFLSTLRILRAYAYFDPLFDFEHFLHTFFMYTKNMTSQYAVQVHAWI